MGFVKRALPIVAAAMLVLSIAATAVFIFRHELLGIFVPCPDGLVKAALNSDGGAIYSRDGKLLRLFPNAHGDLRLNTPLAGFPQVLIDAFLAAEDRSFYKHEGYDTLAIIRAACANIKHHRIVSGASTITQQLIRITKPRPRCFTAKAIELLSAARLEMQMTKNEILEAYLNLVPMPGNIRGVWAASHLLFSKEPAALTLNEAATLAALPQSPSRLNPQSKNGMQRLKIRRNWVLERMVKLGSISAADYKKAVSKPLGIVPFELPSSAPHFTEWVKAEIGTPSGRLFTTLDSTIQSELESVLTSHGRRLARAGARQAAGMIIDTSTMNVLAMTGSLAWNRRNGGFNNGCTAKRSGGSILKPFLYALALEHGFSASSVISDTIQTFKTPQGDYVPTNADRRFYGPITVRTALGSSLNITAVKMLNTLGVENFYKFLAALDLLPPNLKLAERYGLGLAIGNPEINMVSLIKAYGMFAHGGRRVALRFMPGTASASAEIVSPATAWMILDMLADPSARLLTFGNPNFFSFPFPVALKTGTSTNYRDSWLICITPRYIVGLWAGNFDGAPTYGLSGATACGPIAHDLLTDLLSGSKNEWFEKPKSVVSAPVCGFSGKKPTPFCPAVALELFARGNEPVEFCEFHVNQSRFHELPPEYADWIYKRGLPRAADPFTLAGDFEKGDPYAVLPGDTVCGGVRLKEAAQKHSLSVSSPAKAHTAGSKGKIHISQETCEKIYEGKIAIVSPHAGDRFVRSLCEDNLVLLRAIPQEPVSEVIWLVDGREVARAGPPYEAFWPMKPGNHTISALTSGETAAQISITVE